MFAPDRIGLESPCNSLPTQPLFNFSKTAWPRWTSISAWHSTTKSSSPVETLFSRDFLTDSLRSWSEAFRTRSRLVFLRQRSEILCAGRAAASWRVFLLSRICGSPVQSTSSRRSRCSTRSYSDRICTVMSAYQPYHHQKSKYAYKSLVAITVVG